MNTAYLGLATTPHDPAIAIVDGGGEVLFAEGAERHLQNKRAWASPADDLMRMDGLLREYCARADRLVVCTSWTTRSCNLSRFLLLGSLMKNGMKRAFKKIDTLYNYYESRYMAAHMNRFSGLGVEFQSFSLSPDRPVVFRSYNHHMTHAAAACYSSDFTEAVCAVVDGMGEGTATSFFRFEKGRIEKIPGIPRSMASLGWFYSELCRWCGFDPMKGEEWKVMGLASYGKLDEELRQLMHQLIYVKNGAPWLAKKPGPLIRQLVARGCSPGESFERAADLAFTGQHVFSELCSQLLSDAKVQLSENLVLAGGCALNSVWNGVVTQRSPFKRCFVYSAPADDGNAIGAALLGFLENGGTVAPRARVRTPYLGSSVDARQLQRARRYSGLASVELSDDGQLCGFIAEQLTRGRLVGWMHGRAEFGPRALGNRSILADPRSGEVKDRLNNEVKFREQFRPFAPAILHEFGNDYFHDYCETPYMERALRVKEQARGRIPGVVHVDGTGRLQSVTKDMNPKFHLLISKFMELTGVPVVLNTSFNVMGKPIVHGVTDALAVFMTSGLDLVVIENVVFAKDPAVLEGLSFRNRAALVEHAEPAST